MFRLFCQLFFYFNFLNLRNLELYNLNRLNCVNANDRWVLVNIDSLESILCKHWCFNDKHVSLPKRISCFVVSAFAFNFNVIIKLLNVDLGTIPVLQAIDEPLNAQAVADLLGSKVVIPIFIEFNLLNSLVSLRFVVLLDSARHEQGYKNIF